MQWIYKRNKTCKNYSNKNYSTKSTSRKTVLTKCTLTNFYILLAFLLIIIAASICCCFIKFSAKQKYLLLIYHDTFQLKKIDIKKYITKMGSNNELKELDIKNRTCYYLDDIKN